MWRSVARYRATLSIYIGVFFSSILGAMWVHRVRTSDLKYPWGVLESDISAVYAIAHTAGQSWTGTTNNSMGAPFGADFAKIYLLEDLHLFCIRILAHLTNNPFTAINTYYILSFGLSAVSFLYLSDHFSVRREISVPLALAYAWLPYHFSRMHVGHLFLAAYYMLPLGVLVLRRLFQYLSDAQNSFFPPSLIKKAFTALGIIAIGSSGSYYGLFLALLSCSLIFLIIPNRVSVVSAKKLLCTSGVALLFLAAPIARSLLARLNGLNTYASRSPDESVQFGGSITRLLVPWGTWIPDKLKPAVSMMEFEWNAVPLLGVVGIWALIVLGALSVTGITKQPANLDRSILYIFPWSLLLYVSGGLGLVFALLIDPSFRAWNRISILVLTLSLLMLGLLLSQIGSKIILRILSPLILMTAITTQLIPLASVGIGEVPSQTSRATFIAIRNDANAIQKTLRAGCSVLQLPIMMSPEGGQVGDVGNGEHYWLPLLTKDLRWSYGAGKATSEGKFWAPYAGDDPAPAIAIAKRLGFCGVLVNFQSNLDRGQITSLLGDPIFENSQTGNSLFFLQQ